MKLLRKPLALLLSGALLAAAFSGCSSSAPQKDFIVDASGNRVAVESLATIEGKPVTLSEFRSFLLPMIDIYSQQMGPEVWEQYPEMFTALKDSVLETIRWERVSEKFAISKGLEMKEKEKALEIDAYLNNLKEQMGGDVAFAGQLAQMGYTEATFRTQLERQPYTTRLENEITKENGMFSPTEEELKTEFQTNYLRAKHILIANTDETGAPRDAAEVKARADEALARAQKGEDFAALIQEYGEDPGMIQSPDGYYFKEGDMVAEFYEGTKALADNAISGLVESSYGYHIIQRLPLEDAYFESVKTQMRLSIASDKVMTEINALVEQSTIEKTPEFDLITAANADPAAVAASSASSAPASSAASSASSEAAPSEAPASSAPASSASSEAAPAEAPASAPVENASSEAAPASSEAPASAPAESSSSTSSAA